MEGCDYDGAGLARAVHERLHSPRMAAAGGQRHNYFDAIRPSSAWLIETCKLSDVDPLAYLTDARIVNGHRTARSTSCFPGPTGIKNAKPWPEKDAHHRTAASQHVRQAPRTRGCGLTAAGITATISARSLSPSSRSRREQSRPIGPLTPRCC